jgi:hypothetical protein
MGKPDECQGNRPTPGTPHKEARGILVRQRRLPGCHQVDGNASSPFEKREGPCRQSILRKTDQDVTKGEMT